MRQILYLLLSSQWFQKHFWRYIFLKFMFQTAWDYTVCSTSGQILYWLVLALIFLRSQHLLTPVMKPEHRANKPHCQGENRTALRVCKQKKALSASDEDWVKAGSKGSGIFIFSPAAKSQVLWSAVLPSLSWILQQGEFFCVEAVELLIHTDGTKLEAKGKCLLYNKHKELKCGDDKCCFFCQFFFSSVKHS